MTDAAATPGPEIPSQTSGSSGSEKLGAVLIALLLFAGSQALAIIRIAPHIFSAETLRKFPWIGVYEHHLWQLVYAVIFIGIFSRGNFSAWGLNLRNADLSWRILWRFCFIYFLIVMAISTVPDLLSHSSDLGSFAPATAGNMAGWLSFEWIFVGISEEIMFRGLLQTYLSKTWAGLWIVRGIPIPHAGLITTIIFCLAHISPLHPQVNWEQQLFAFGLGIYYSTVYYRTGSLLNPILAHNFGDGFGVTAAYITYLHLH